MTVYVGTRGSSEMDRQFCTAREARRERRAERRLAGVQAEGLTRPPPTPRLTYTLFGLALGAAAPLGSFAIRLLTFRSVRRRPLRELRRHLFFYLYELCATSLVFGAAGFAAGTRAHLLREKESFYHDLADHDPLTALYNGRAFQEFYERARARAAANGLPLAIVLVDLDRLKEINDAHGHEAGNRALVLVADALRASKRVTDIAARWGGDEFSILMEGADVTAARRVAESIVAQVRNASPAAEQGTVSVTVGVCAASCLSPSDNLFGAADRALLAGKARGREAIEIVSL
jgi:diguanylate cyclase (GGDEF)-like protein